jgi:hypothetical protein
VLWRLSLEILGQVHQAAPRAHVGQLLGFGLVLASLSGLVCSRLAGSRRAAVPGALAGSALSVAIGLTLFRDVPRLGGAGLLRACALTDPTLLTGDGVANLVLFAPAAFLGVLAIGRPWHVAAAITAVSLTVEGLQAVRSVGVCDSSDALLNALGALVAAVTAAVTREALAPARPIAHACVPGSDACHRSC